jgi:hypothetical protein
MPLITLSPRLAVEAFLDQEAEASADEEVSGGQDGKQLSEDSGCNATCRRNMSAQHMA